jgi:hypothetical protein
MSIIVGDHIGVDTSTESLTFGMVMPGYASSTRFIRLDNYNDYPLIADIKKTGEIAGWVTLNEDKFIMEPRSNKTISASAVAPINAKYGNHTGNIKVIFKRVI